MSVYLISLSGGNNTLPANWNSVLNSQTSPLGLVDDAEGASALTIEYTATPSGEASGASSLTAGSGDASWVIAAAVEGGHTNTSNAAWVSLLLSGAAEGDIFDVRCFGSSSTGGRITEFEVNGDSQDLAIGGSQTTNDVRFANVTANASGEVVIQYREASGSTGTAYANALYIADAAAPDPSVTLDNGTLEPGTEFTLTATNYASAPVSPATLTDSAGSTITVAVTISGSGPYTAVGTMPTLAEAVTAGTSLLFGDVTIELST